MDDKTTAYLAALAGQGSAPTPVTRDEALLNAIIDRIAAIEEGGGGGGVIVIQEGENHTLPLTWQQIYDGLAQGIIYNVQDLYSDTDTGEFGVGVYQVVSAYFLPHGAGDAPTYIVSTSQAEYEAQSPDDYPSYED